MDSEFALVEEDWRDSLQRLVRSVDSSAFSGDAPRERMKEELMRTLAQSKSVMAASEEVRMAMDSLYELMSESHPRDNAKRLRR